jgi:hypothetical protein
MISSVYKTDRENVTLELMLQSNMYLGAWENTNFDRELSVHIPRQ